MKGIIVGKKGQRRLVYHSFWNEPKTMLQVSQETDIKRKNICWYVREKRISRTIYPLGREYCPQTKRMAMRYTTNPTRAWSYYIQYVKKEWEHLPQEGIDIMWAIIRGYVLNGFPQDGIKVPQAFDELWIKRVKPIIDGRAGL